MYGTPHGGKAGMLVATKQLGSANPVTRTNPTNRSLSQPREFVITCDEMSTPYERPLLNTIDTDWLKMKYCFFFYFISNGPRQEKVNYITNERFTESSMNHSPRYISRIIKKRLPNFWENPGTKKRIPGNFSKIAFAYLEISWWAPTYSNRSANFSHTYPFWRSSLSKLLLSDDFRFPSPEGEISVIPPGLDTVFRSPKR